MSAPAINMALIVWLVFSVTIGVVTITATILLLKERHISAWLMLIGSILTALSGAASRLAIQFVSLSGPGHLLEKLYQVIGGVAALGSLLFAIGLLLFALHRRSQRHRIAELEQIVASHAT